MPVVRYLAVNQIRIFPSDELPIDFSHLPSATGRLQQEFNFRQAGPAAVPISMDPNGAVVFNDGEHEFEENRYLIQFLLIESRRIILSYTGPSKAANAFMAQVIEIIKAFDQHSKGKLYLPLIMTEETSTVQQLSFSFAKLVSAGPLTKFYAGLADHIDKAGCRLSFTPSSFSVKVSYLDVPERILETGISIQDKVLQIELRNQTAAGDCVYFIKSPNSTDEHLKLVEFFETMVMES